MTTQLLCGQTYPLGATVYPTGVNFCIYSREATRVELLLFDDPEAPQPAQVFVFDPDENHTFFYWHGFVSGLKAGQVYAYRVYGPFNPEQGQRFDSEKVLLDPYAKAIVGWQHYSRDAAIAPGDNCDRSLRGVVVDPLAYDWEDDAHPRIPYASSVIYEMHVGGFTRNANSGVAPEKRGTYAGIIDKIPYLKDLGITAIELLPIHQFDEQDVPLAGENYWGYSSIAFFAPHAQYSSCHDPLGPLDEFRDMVKALHHAGIEVILDVVFNHTAEGHEEGPTLSFKGLDNIDYYHLEDDDLSKYKNYSGCGNTFNANHAVCARLIVDCLHYWVTEMHVDGFRFDLASVLSRGQMGDPLEDPPILWTIDSDPALAGTKIVAEAWDAAGLYQVGSFIGNRFAEWNGPFRDDVRKFVKSDVEMVGRLAARIMGSPDIYRDPNREPNRSINFITCHDGFTLRDLVSYNEKHNEANGEENQDGANDNFSWNCGVEGDTDDPKISALRWRQMKNLLTILFFSQGTPMILMGDEVGRSQNGNNNGYCQNNELSWFDWDDVMRHGGFRRFVRGIIDCTQKLEIFQQERFLHVHHAPKKRTSPAPLPTEPAITWHGLELYHPGWELESHCLAFELHHPEAEERLHVMLNAYWKAFNFELPLLPEGQSWRRVVDTALASPEDYRDPQEAIAITDSHYCLTARSAVVLMAQSNDT